MRKRTKIVPNSSESHEIGSIMRPIATETTAQFSYQSGPFSPCSEDFSHESSEDTLQTTESVEESLVELGSKLVLDYADPPMTPPAEGSAAFYSGERDQCKSPLRLPVSTISTETIDDENDILLFDNFESSLNLGKSSRCPSNSNNANKRIHNSKSRNKSNSSNAWHPYITASKRPHTSTKLQDSTEHKSGTIADPQPPATTHTVCGSRKLPFELWIIVFSFLPPKVMARILKTCSIFSIIAFDQVYWKKACLNAGVDCSLLLQRAKRQGVQLDGFSLSSSTTTVIRTSPYVNVAEYLSINKLEIHDADEGIVSAATGLKRRLVADNQTNITKYYPSKAAPPLQPRQRRKITPTGFSHNHEAVVVEAQQPWWTQSKSFYPKPTNCIPNFQSATTTSKKSKSFQKLSWYHVYASQFKTRATFLQSPYTFRRQNASHGHGITCIETITGLTTGEDLVLTGSWDGTMKVWKLVSSPKMSESAKRVLDGLCWDEIIRGRKQQRRSEENANGWDENTDQGEIYDEEEEEEGDSIGLEDSIWLSGVENDTMGIGELVEHVHGEILNSADEQSDVRHNMGSNQTKSWTGAGKYELELVKSIEASYPIECMSIDGNHLVTGGRGPTPLTLWTLSPYPKVIRHLTATKPFLRPPHQHSSSHITCIHVSYPYAVTAQKQLLQIWHLPTATLLAAVSKQTDSNTSCVKLVQNENTGVWWIFEACAYGSISVWKIDNRTTPILSTTPRNNNRNTTTQNQEHQIPSSIKIKPIPDPLRSSLEEAREIECIVYGAEALTFMGSFETMGGINSAQIRETGVENHWELLCGFKDGNIRGWNVGLSCSNSVDTPSQATDPDGYMINQITIKTTGSLCSLGDWITWLNEDPIADVVIAGAWDGRIRVWDKRKKALRRSLVSDIRSAVLCLKTVGEYFLVAGSYNGSLVVYDFSRTK